MPWCRRRSSRPITPKSSGHPRPLLQHRHRGRPLRRTGARNRPFDRDRVFADLSHAAADRGRHRSQGRAQGQLRRPERGSANTSYQVRGIGGATHQRPEEKAGRRARNRAAPGSSSSRFKWWNLAVPLIAILGLLGLSRMRFGRLGRGAQGDRRGAEPDRAERRRVPPRARQRPRGPRPRRAPSLPRRPPPSAPMRGRHEAQLTASIRSIRCRPNTACSRTRVSLGRGDRK